MFLLYILYFILGLIGLFIFSWLFIIALGYTIYFLFGKKEIYRNPFIEFIQTFTLKYYFFTFRVKYKVIDRNIIPDSDFIVVGNHISNYDPFLLMVALSKTRIAGISKKEISEVPLLGLWMKILRVLPLDRTDNRGAAKVMIKAIKQAKEGQPMFVFPEGGRNKTDQPLLDFKPGAFKLVEKSKKDMYFVCFKGFNNHKTFKLKRVACTIKFSGPITYEQYKDLTTAELAELAHQKIAEELKKL